VLLAIAIPTVSLVFYIAWKYRESNTKPTRKLKAHQSKYHVLGIWMIPILIMFIIAGTMIPATHRLDPRVAIESDVEPMTIQVVALRWKWLFIYPEQQIATVNFVQIPVDTPVEFQLTSDESPMSSFWIPNLGGQLYTMTGHVNRLNLMANTIGDYPGSSAEINGRGFAGMKFTARASSEENFDKWVEVVKQSPDALDSETYDELLEPSESNPPAFFSTADSEIYTNVVMKYATTAEGHEH
jgi:cytochrome o ubiquinol oxidase subunit 2